MIDKFVCIHGHFYQPPRENPWLESIELQESAFPYHDWNERIAAECYAPNATARLLDGKGRIERIVNNYSRISFNVGPTLLYWMRKKAPDVYEALLEADRKGSSHYGGHGPAIAQCCNHAIMPLANERDKRTEALWGIRVFEEAFRRPPEGMWLPETAADIPTLEVLAECGIKFTILSPFQASRTRALEAEEWEDVNGGRIDPRKPYLIRLPSGRSMAVFFYDAQVAKAVAFERLLMSGEEYAKRLLAALEPEGEETRIENVATDGESYGHHFQHGDMALAYALQSIESGGRAKLTVYGEYLEKFPPVDEVEIHQPSAWSCSHGVDRWRADCGCNSGRAGWNQSWRKPLREAMNWLRDQLVARYETAGKGLLRDPWAARDDYISIILDRSPENVARFFSRHAVRDLNEGEVVSVLRLLEMQHNALKMFTSCGWFFDEISGIETVQVIQYAARAIQLAADFPGGELEPEFLEMLAKARSNIPENRDGRTVYERFVRPAIMTRETIGAHYAISSLFESYPDETRIYEFTVQQKERQLFTAGNARLALGRINVIFERTRASDLITYAVIHMGEHNVSCGVRYDGDLEEYHKLVAEMRGAFERADFPEIIRQMDRHFGGSNYTLKNLFRDEQARILNQILTTTREGIQGAYHLITDRYAPLARFLAGLHLPPIRALSVAMEVVLNTEIKRQFEADRLDIERLRSLLAECEASHVTLAVDELAYACKGHLDRLSDQFAAAPEDFELLQRYVDAAALARALPFEVNLWKPQNAYYQRMTSASPKILAEHPQESDALKVWREKFNALGECLGFHVESQGT